MEERTDKRKKLYIELAAPPKNVTSFMMYFDIEGCFLGIGTMLVLRIGMIITNGNMAEDFG